MAAKCTHIAEHLKKVKPHTKGCEECMQMGDTWVHLRMCLECGHVGCCDSSKNRHARGHFHSTQHPLIQSAEKAKTGAGAISTISTSSVEMHRAPAILKGNGFSEGYGLQPVHKISRDHGL